MHAATPKHSSGCTCAWCLVWLCAVSLGLRSGLDGPYRHMVNPGGAVYMGAYCWPYSWSGPAQGAVGFGGAPARRIFLPLWPVSLMCVVISSFTGVFIGLYLSALVCTYTRMRNLLRRAAWSQTPQQGCWPLLYRSGFRNCLHLGAHGAWWSSRSSKPCGGRVTPVPGEFDSHTLPLLQNSLLLIGVSKLPILR